MISCRCCWLQLKAPISNCGSGIIWSGCPFSLKNDGRFARVKSTHGQLPVPKPTIATSGGVPQLASLPYIFIHIRSILCVTSTTITHKWYKIAGRRAASQAKCAIMYTTHHTKYNMTTESRSGRAARWRAVKWNKTLRRRVFQLPFIKKSKKKESSDVQNRDRTRCWFQLSACWWWYNKFACYLHLLWIRTYSHFRRIFAWVEPTHPHHLFIGTRERENQRTRARTVEKFSCIQKQCAASLCAVFQIYPNIWDVNWTTRIVMERSTRHIKADDC